MANQRIPVKEVLARLKKIEGQARGLQGMIEGGAPCPDILTQVAAVTAAVKRVGALIMEGYLEECLEKTPEKLTAGERDRLKEFHQAFSRYLHHS